MQLVKGGQGRSDTEVEASARNMFVCCVLALLVLCALACAGCAATGVDKVWTNN